MVQNGCYLAIKREGRSQIKVTRLYLGHGTTQQYLL